MTWLWLTAFSALGAAAAGAAEVRGTVTISNSTTPEVRKGRDYSGVVVWMERTGGGEAHPVQGAAPRLKMEQKDKRFIPHVLAAPVGAAVEFPNLDPIFHSAFSNFSGQIFDFGLYAPGTSRAVTFTRAGVVRIFCNIHPTMSAVIVVLKEPWFAVSGASGAFVIHDVPDGDYRLRVYHERATQETLAALERRIQVAGATTLAPIAVSETGYVESPHKNKYGHEYPPAPADGAGTYPASHR